MKRIFPILLLALLGCSAGPDGSAAPTLEPLPTATALPTLTPNAPSGPLGSEENPLVLALPPSTKPEPDVLTAGKTLSGLLEKTTGYKFVSVIPPNENELIHALGAGNAHLAPLSPFAYVMASQQGAAQAALAREQDGNVFYGAQFIAHSGPDYVSYFDPVQSKNVREAPTALSQFADKKPCWTDQRSPSGYVVPLGILQGAGVQTRAPAFLASHPAVVRAIYAGGICDFGATYVDARLYPGLEDQLPDVTKKVEVIWQIPPIIPYETIVLGRGVPSDVRRVLTRAFIDLMPDPQAKSAMQTLYGFSTMQAVQDGQYADFVKAVKDSGVSLDTLIDQ
jgi:phosphonate transport system substrate-binding protein